MEATYKTVNGRMVIKAQAEKMTDLFGQLAEASEVFESASVCGMCNSAATVPQHRAVVKGTKTFHFYEMRCTACQARFAFGQTADDSGSLFPKRKDKEGNWLPHNGWSKYSTSQEDSGPEQPEMEPQGGGRRPW